MEVLLAVLLFGLAQGSDVFLGDLPMQNPDLFGGDMVGVEDPGSFNPERGSETFEKDVSRNNTRERNAVVNKNMLWPEGVVPYELDPGRTVNLALLHGAFYMYKKDTCIRFVERTNEKDFVRIISGQGCYSHVGKTGGMQPVSLGPGCHFMGTVLHEFAHALGFYHEQNRSDRDDFLTIYWENIQDGMDDQFMKLKPNQNDLLTEFDYDSLMLYGSYTFSKDRKNLMTMARKNDPSTPIKDVVQKYSFSRSDINRINKLYNCTKYLKK